MTERRVTCKRCGAECRLLPNESGRLSLYELPWPGDFCDKHHDCRNHQKDVIEESRRILKERGVLQ